VVDLLQVTHPIIEIYGKEWKEKKGWKDTFALAPGVLAQTGMEAGEIVKALCKEMQLDLILVVDALAARSVSRLNCTIQLTNTGISPGSGVGNNRKEITKRTMGVDVIAIGVPTVVDAETIVEEYVEEGFYKMGLGEKDMEICLREMRGGKMKGLFMASKSIDEDVQRMSKIIGDALNRFILDLPEKRKHI
jgi:spore protease